MARPCTLYGNHVSNQSSSRTTSRKPRFFWLRLFQKKKKKKEKKLEICKRLKYKVRTTSRKRYWRKWHANEAMEGIDPAIADDSRWSYKGLREKKRTRVRDHLKLPTHEMWSG